MKSSVKAVLIVVMYIIIFGLVCAFYGIPETLKQLVGNFLLSILFSALYFAVGPCFSLFAHMLIGDGLFRLLRRVCKSDGVAHDVQFFLLLFLGLFMAAGFFALLSSSSGDSGPSVYDKYRL